MKRMLALALCLLLLPSCSTMLVREHTVTADHQENPLSPVAGVYRVGSYTALQSALLNYVESGMDSGTLRFPTTYDGNLTVDLEKARRQLMENEPLGAYALEEMTYHISRIISYYEVALTFTYAVDKTQITPQRLRTAAELQTVLESALTQLEPQRTVYLLNYPEMEPDYFDRALRSAYDALPACAQGLPRLEVTLYPNTGSRRIAVLDLTYPSNTTAQLYTRDRLEEAARRVAGDTQPTPEAIYDALRAVCTFDPEGNSTPHAALVRGAADREGMAFAYLLLAQALDVPCSLYRAPAEGCLIAFPDAGGDRYLDVAGPRFYLSPTLPIEYPAPGEEAPDAGDGDTDTDTQQEAEHNE